MIVRISGEDQYQLDDGERERLNALEHAVVETVGDGREADFQTSYAALLDYVREHGTKVGEDELVTSDVILPPADLGYVEAGKEFTGEGLIPE